MFLDVKGYDAYLCITPVKARFPALYETGLKKRSFIPGFNIIPSSITVFKGG